MRLERAEKRRRRYEEDYSDHAVAWAIYKSCELCGRQVCVNNFPDHQPRSKRYTFKGVLLCSYCDPRDINRLNLRRDDTQIKYKRRYRTLMAWLITQKLARYGCLYPLEDIENCKCAGCLAMKLVTIDDDPEELKKGVLR